MKPDIDQAKSGVIYASLASIVFLVAAATADGAEKPGCTIPTFEDNFLDNSLDKMKWSILNARKPEAEHPKSGLQNYSANGVKTGPGGLQIVISEKQPGSQYWSGRIGTKQAFLYGHFEFEAKLPVGRGLWPGLWMRTPTNLPLNGEIDLVEAFGSDPNAFQSTLHPWVDGRENRQYCALISVRGLSTVKRPACATVSDKIKLSSNLSKDFHTYAVDWKPDQITWSLDGIPYFSVREEIPASPMAIFINLAISPLHDGASDESLRLPQILAVRKVRVCEGFN